MALHDISENRNLMVPLGPTDELVLHEGVILDPRGTRGLYGIFRLDNGHSKITIHGSVLANTYAIDLGQENDGTQDIVDISATGRLLSGSGNAIQLSDGTVNNHGLIEGGVFSWNSLTLLNTGHISKLGGSAQPTAVFTHGGQVTVMNAASGVIEGGRWGISGSDFGDTVTNDGTIRSDGAAVVLGGGDDLYDGRNGIVTNLAGTAMGVISMGDGKDTVYGGAGREHILGGAGDDILNGGGGNDRLEGGAGNDTYYVDHPDDLVIEAAGEGTADHVYAAVTHRLSDHVENATAIGSSAVDLTGNNLGNIPKGNARANRIHGGNGHDTLMGEAGNDRLYGDGHNDRLLGGTGHDSLSGGSGNDVLYGGAGNDVLTGGAGKDIFVFDKAPNRSTNKDRIMDWSAKDDTIRLENAVFKALKKTGKLSKSFFTIGSKANDANDFVGYDKKTGDLWYDSNGSKAGGQVVFANIGKNKAIAYNDFVVV